MINGLFNAFIQHFIPAPPADNFFSMREERHTKKAKEIEMLDFNEARTEEFRKQEERSFLQKDKIPLQVNEAALKLIPTTRITGGVANRAFDPITFAFFQFIIADGNIKLIKTENPPQLGHFFVVQSKNDVKLVAQSTPWWSYSSKIVSVNLHAGVEGMETDPIALDILVKARSVLERGEIKEMNSELHSNDVEMTDLN